MPFDSNGNATVTRNRAVTGQTVQAAQVNTPFDDVQSMLSQVLLRSGVAPMTGALNMNGFRGISAADGVASTDLATVGQVQSATPIGSVLSFAGTNAPTGWMLCFGQAVSRVDYAALFNVIGTAWGSGDGSTTFNVPDLRGRIEAGKDDMGGTDATRLSFFGSLAKTIGGVFGSSSVSLTSDQNGPHAHTGSTDPGGDHRHSFLGGGFTGAGPTAIMVRESNPSIGFSEYIQPSGNHIHSFTTAASGLGNAHSNAQPTAIMNKIIKVS